MQPLKLQKSYSKYPEYKDSGVEWLGNIPNNWNTHSMQHLFNKTKRTGYKDEELLSVYRDLGVIIKSSRSDNFNKESLDLSPYQLVKKDDLVINKMKAWQGSLSISRYKGIVSPAYYVCKPLTKNNPRFLHYLLRSSIYIKQYERNSGGVRNNQWDLNYGRFKKIEAIIPKINAQTKIANYLDKKTKIIDEIIEKKKKLINLLKEKRTATITQTATKGLNPNAKLKPSGVDWIGDIPKQWEIIKLKSSFKFEKGKNSALYTKEYVGNINNSGVYPVYSGQTENKGILGLINTYDYDYRNGVLFTTTVGAKAMTPQLLKGKFSLSQNCALIISTSNVFIDYFYFQLHIIFNRMKSEIPSYMQPSLRISDLKEFITISPPVIIQKKIAYFLKTKTSQINKILKIIESQINSLNEYRSSLIYHAVTGKIKI